MLLSSLHRNLFSQLFKRHVNVPVFLSANTEIVDHYIWESNKKSAYSIKILNIRDIDFYSTLTDHCLRTGHQIFQHFSGAHCFNYLSTYSLSYDSNCLHYPPAASTNCHLYFRFRLHSGWKIISQISPKPPTLLKLGLFCDCTRRSGILAPLKVKIKFMN